MSLDTKYRPQNLDDVLGQEATIKILRRFVATGKGRYQSYLFCGPWGSGKTTLGRILARALLCESPTPEGDPCNKCLSCRSLLELGSSHDFMEVDAATNSGKAEIEKILESIQYDSFSGRRRLFLFDECFVAGTLVLTREGFQRIDDLVNAKYSGEVLAQTEDGLLIWTPVTNWFDQGERSVVTLSFDNGTVLTVTGNQKIRTSNRGWVEAQALTFEDDVIEWSKESNER